jgi:hypothetical protein
MDTRRKIVLADAVPAGCTVVTGYFDPLLAADVRELAAIPKPICAIVLPLDRALLSQQARAELVAALRIIDYVVIASDASIVDRLRATEIVHLEEAQSRRARELKEHVRRRQIR